MSAIPPEAADVPPAAAPSLPRPSLLTLAEAGIASASCLQLLDAGLQLGRNVLVLGPYAACAPLLLALLEASPRPVWLASRAADAPEGGRMGRADDATAAAIAGADRLGLWAVSPAQVMAGLLQANGVVAHLEADSIARGLMRLELAAGPVADSALAILAGVDLLVQVGRGQAARVQEVVEVRLTDGGYQPLQLFARQSGQMGTALVPKAAASFLPELASMGLGGLMQELRLATAAGRAGPGPAGPADVDAAAYLRSQHPDDDDLDGAWPATSTQQEPVARGRTPRPVPPDHADSHGVGAAFPPAPASACRHGTFSCSGPRRRWPPDPGRGFPRPVGPPGGGPHVSPACGVRAHPAARLGARQARRARADGRFAARPGGS